MLTEIAEMATECLQISLKRSFLDLFYLFLPSETPFDSIIAYFYSIAGEVAPVRLKYIKVSEYAKKYTKNHASAIIYTFL